MLRYKTETRPGLVALYDIRPGNGAGPFLQPRSPHGATLPSGHLQARRSAGWREALQRPQREERGGGISWRPPAYSLFTTLYLAARWLRFHQHLKRHRVVKAAVTIRLDCNSTV